MCSMTRSSAGTYTDCSSSYGIAAPKKLLVNISSITHLISGSRRIRTLVSPLLRDAFTQRAEPGGDGVAKCRLELGETLGVEDLRL